jgi:hypothetical protein
LTKEHVLRALSDLDSGIDYPFGPPTGYELILQDKRYPPKAAIGLACRYLLGRVLQPQFCQCHPQTIPDKIAAGSPRTRLPVLVPPHRIGSHLLHRDCSKCSRSALSSLAKGAGRGLQKPETLWR